MLRETVSRPVVRLSAPLGGGVALFSEVDVQIWAGGPAGAASQTPIAPHTPGAVAWQSAFSMKSPLEGVDRPHAVLPFLFLEIAL